MLGFAWRRPAASSNPPDVTPCLLPTVNGSDVWTEETWVLLPPASKFQPHVFSKQGPPLSPQPQIPPSRFPSPILPLVVNRGGRKQNHSTERMLLCILPTGDTFPGPTFPSLVTQWAPRLISYLRWGQQGAWDRSGKRK